MVVKLSTLRVSAEMDASKYVAGMNAKVAADKQGAASSAQVGAAIAATDTKISSASNGVERLSRSYVAGYASEAKFEAALRTLSRALDTGNVSADRAQHILVGLHARYGLMANASDIASRGQHQLAAAVAAANSGLDAQTGAMMQANTATTGMRHNTAGIAAQFQDIGVTAAMGMNPLMIALQQGTQLTGQLAVMDKPLQTLGKSLISLISPLSIVTIGLVALAAAGLQMVDWGSTAEAVLDGLADVLVPIAPYAAAAAAGLALLYSPAIVVGIVNVVAALASLAAQVITTAAVMVAANPVGALILGFAAAATAAIIFRDDLARILGRDIVADAQKAINWIIGSFVGGFNGIKATWSMLPAAIGDLVTQAANNTIAGVESMINFVGKMVNDFIKSINSAIMMVPEQFRAGWTGLGEIGQVNFGRIENPNEGKAGDVADQIDDAMAAAQAYDYVGTAAAFVQGAASGAADALRGLADAAGASGEESGKAAKEAAKLAKAYDDIVAGAHKFIQEQENERAVLGQTEEQANALRYTFDLLNKAKEAGIDLSAPQIAELSNLGREMAAAEAETERLTKAFEDQKKVVDDVLGTIGDAFSGLFDGTIKDFDGFIDHMLSGFAKLGQGNIDKLFTTDGLAEIFNGNPTAANDNGEGPTNIFDAIFKGSKAGTQAGAEDGLMGALKGAGGLGDMASAGLGGFGMGAQSQSPVIGALGGALSGFAAGGPVGAVVGGITGFIGGLFGMNQALQDNRKKLDENRAAIEQFISASLGESVSTYAKALDDARAKAKQMIDLANAAQDWDLAARISKALNKLPGTLAREFQKDLKASINELEGNSWLNDAAAAQKRYNDRLADAAALGVSADGAMTELSLSLRKIVEDGDLTESQIRRLVRMFPEMADELKKLADGIGAMTIEQARSDVERAKQDLRTAYEAEANALRTLIDRNRQFIRSLGDFKDSLRLDSNLSGLSPMDRFLEAQRQYDDVSKRAARGDESALAKLEEVSRAYLNEAKNYYASSDRYFEIFGQVESMLDKTIGNLESGTTIAERQLAALDEQVSKMTDIDKSVMSVADAIDRLNVTMRTLARMEKAGASALPAFASGGSFKIGGAGGIDQNLLSINGTPSARVSRGEIVNIQRPGSSNDNSSAAVLTELRALRNEVASLRGVTAAGAKVVADAAAGTTQAVRDGNRQSSQVALKRG